MGSVPGNSAAHPRVQDSLSLGTAAPISEVRVDANDDRVPDRVGDTVTVAGRAVVGRGRLAVPVSEMVVLQDSTGGLHVVMPAGASINRGDSIRVRGIVAHEYGLTQLQGLDYRRIDGPARSPAPLPVRVTAAIGEQYEGRLVEVQGHVASTGSNAGGEYLLLSGRTDATSSRLTVFVANRHTGRIGIDRFEKGDDITVTGVVGQHDFDAPYTEYYQLEPRSRSDLARVGGMPSDLRTALYVLGGGGLLAVIVIFVLQAAVRRRTRELAESRERFQRLAEATAEGVALHKADGEIIDVNTALADMVGLDREALVGRDVADVLPATPNDPAQEVEGEAEAPTEAELVPEEGRSIPVEIEERTVTTDETTVHVCAVRDVTKRKEWEKEILIAKQEAEQMARLKSNLLNNMSHELRTPVTNITGYAELIVNEAEGPHERFAAKILKSGQRLSETLQSVLDMAQIEADTLDILVQEVGVATIVQEVLDRHVAELDERDELTVEVDVPDGYTLQTDRTLLYRILNNLVQNAIKFTEEGTIGVTAEPMEEGVRIGVRDTGVGIEREFQPHLFDPFKQESEGLGREYEGTGLGLALTKRMVDLLGGTIEVESTKGEGSVFTVELPSMTDPGTPILDASDAHAASSSR
ncbi:MAG: ATP-binding protein [Salinibacter sp.]